MKTLITGASRGIGHSLAHEFARHGHDLVLSARDQKALEQLASALRINYSVNVDIISMDLSHPGGAARLTEEIDNREHHIECLVNNAGFGFLGDYIHMTSQCLNELLELNICAVSELTRHYVQEFVRAKKGKILQVASVAAFQPGPRMAAYYASKAYVVSMSQALAYELRGSGVQMTILCPGATETDFHKTAASFNNQSKVPHYAGVMNADKVAQLAYNGLEKNKLFVIPGLLNKFLVLGSSFFPVSLSTRIAALFNRK